MLPQPPDGYRSEDVARTELSDFLLAGKYDPLVLPKRCEPATVDDFVKQAFEQDKKLNVKGVRRCGLLMAFYDLQARAEQLDQFYDRRAVGEEAFERALSAIGLACDFGPPPIAAKAVDAYRGVLGLDLSPQQWEVAIDTFFHLPADADPAWLTGPLDRQAAALKPKIESDPDAEVAFHRIEDWKSDRIASVMKARDFRSATLKHKPLERRVKDYSRAYLGLERNGYVDLQWWGVMMLQRECNAAEPAKIAGALTEGMDLLMNRAGAPEKLPPGDKKDLAGYTTRLTRAIDFYGGILTPEQKKFADENQRDQSDVLHWD